MRVLATSDPVYPKSRVWRFPAWFLVACLLVFHLVMGPLLGLAFVDFQGSTSERMTRALASVPDDPALARQDLVLLNPPDSIYVVGGIVAPTRRWRVGRALADSELSAMALRRSRSPALDEASLEIRFEQGLFPDSLSRYYRSAGESFAVNEEIVLGDLTIEVAELQQNGDPNRVIYPVRAPTRPPIPTLAALAERDLCALDSARDRQISEDPGLPRHLRIDRSLVQRTHI